MKKKRNRGIQLLLPLCVVGLLAFYLIARGLNSKQDMINSMGAKAAPTWELPDATGKKYRLENFKGKVVLLHFWASWCAPCLEEIPQWVELGTRYKDHPVMLIAVSLDKNWEDAQKVLPQQNLNPSQLVSFLDISGKTPDDYGTYQFPETYLINKDQRIVMKWVWPQAWDRPEIHKMIDQVLQAQ